MAQQQIAASIFDINIGARTMLLVSLALLAILTIVPAAQSQTFTVLHTFTGAMDGAAPAAGLTRDAAGNFYGTTGYGGSGTGVCAASGCGTVYKLVRRGSGWVLNPIYEFSSTNQGPFNPEARIVFGPDGSLYGTTVNGGTCGPYWCGTVYKLQPPASFCRSVMCPWSLTVVHMFAGGSDGAFPYSDLTFDQDGNIYGTTSGDGDSPV